MIRYKSIVKGAGSYVFSMLRRSDAGRAGVATAEGAYAIFMRYVAALGRVGISFEDKVVVEFGPGSSNGLGLAALLCGARRYYGFDVIDHTADARNLMIFDQLSEMFERRAPLPCGGFCDRIFPCIDDPAFPGTMLPDALLAQSLRPDRVRAIRDDLASGGDTFVRRRSSTDLSAATIDEPADIILSESVLEHVDDLESIYRLFGRWLAPDGVMVHLIDYTSHNLSSVWNGHWQCSPSLWSIVRGRRHYLINRAPHQTHLDLLARNRLDVVHSDLLRRLDGLTLDELSPDVRATMSPRDATIALAAITCRRTGAQGVPGVSIT